MANDTASNEKKETIIGAYLAGRYAKAEPRGTILGIEAVTAIMASCLADATLATISEDDPTALKAFALQKFFAYQQINRIDIADILQNAARKKYRAPFITDLLNADDTYAFFDRQDPRVVLLANGRREGVHSLVGFLNRDAFFLWRHVRKPLYQKLRMFSADGLEELWKNFQALISDELSDEDFLFELNYFFDVEMPDRVAPAWPAYFLRGMQPILIAGEYPLGKTPIDCAIDAFLGKSEPLQKRLVLLIKKMREFSAANSEYPWGSKREMPKIVPLDILFELLKNGNFASYLPCFIKLFFEEFPCESEEKSAPEKNLLFGFFAGLTTLATADPTLVRNQMMVSVPAILEKLVAHQAISTDQHTWPVQEKFRQVHHLSMYIYFQTYRAIWLLFLDSKIDAAQRKSLIEALKSCWPNANDYFYEYLFLSAVKSAQGGRSDAQMVALNTEMARLSEALTSDKTLQSKNWNTIFNAADLVFEAPNINANQHGAKPECPDAPEYDTILQTAKIELITKFPDLSSKKVAKSISVSAYLHALQTTPDDKLAVDTARDAFLKNYVFLQIGRFCIYKTKACATAINDAINKKYMHENARDQLKISAAVHVDLYQVLYENQLSNKEIIRTGFFAIFIAPMVWLFRKIYGSVEAVEIYAPVTSTTMDIVAYTLKSQLPFVGTTPTAAEKDFCQIKSSLGWIETKTPSVGSSLRFFGLRDDISITRAYLTEKEPNLSARPFNQFCNRH